MAASLFGETFNAMANMASTMYTNDENVSQQQRNNQANLEIAQLTNQANLDLARQQNAWNVQQWNRQNEFNSPANQVQRLRAAGLSSAAAAQSVSNLPSGELQSANLANQQLSAPFSTIPRVAPNFDMNLIGAAREFELYRQEKAKADVDEATKPTNIQNVLTEGDAKKWALANAINQFMFDYKANPYKLESIKYHAKADSYLPATSFFGMKLVKQNVLSAKQQYSFLEQFNPEQIRKIGAEIDEILARASKERAEKAKVDAETGLVGEQTENVKKVNVGLDVENALKRFGAPSSPSQKFGALVASGKLKAKDVTEYLKAVRSYVESGGKVFDSNNPDLRDVFINELNPGIGESYKMSLGSMAPVRFGAFSFTKPYRKIK